MIEPPPKSVSERVSGAVKGAMAVVGKHVPSRGQYQKWTLPSKYALWGIVIGVFSLLLGIGSFVLTVGDDPVAAAKSVEVTRARARIESGLERFKASFREHMAKDTKALSAFGIGTYVHPPSPMLFFNAEDIDLVHGPGVFQRGLDITQNYYWGSYTKVSSIAQYIENIDAYETVVESYSLLDDAIRESEQDVEETRASGDDPTQDFADYMDDLQSGKFGDINGLKSEYMKQKQAFKEAYDKLVFLLAPESER